MNIETMKTVKNPPPCFYKKSCGWEICMDEDCPDYRAKKRGEPFLGERKDGENND